MSNHCFRHSFTFFKNLLLPYLPSEYTTYLSELFQQILRRCCKSLNSLKFTFVLGKETLSAAPGGWGGGGGGTVKGRRRDSDFLERWSGGFIAIT